MSTTAMPGNAADGRNGGVPKKIAFVAAPSFTAARLLGEALAKLGFDSLTTFDADMPGRTILEITRDCMDRSELVVAVLDDGPMERNVFFELGLAHGLGKRILIIAGEHGVPTAQSLGDPYIRMKPNDTEAIGFAVRQVLLAPHHGSQPMEPSTQQTQAINGLADELLAELRHTTNLTQEQLVRIIQRAIEGSGVTAASKERFRDANVDLAVWSEDIEPWVRNPLIIEVKRDVSSGSDAELVVERVQRYMEKTHVSTALVLYLRADPMSLDRVQRSDILFMSVQVFLESLRHRSFGEVIRQLRNEMIHGVS